MPKFGSLMYMAAASALAATFVAQAQSGSRVDENGFWREMTCDTEQQLKNRMRDTGKAPTGTRASTKDWEIEIFQNPTNGAWTALGTNKNPDFGTTASSSLKINWCPLMSGSGSRPYTEQLFYKLHFKQ